MFNFLTRFPQYVWIKAIHYSATYLASIQIVHIIKNNDKTNQFESIRSLLVEICVIFSFIFSTPRIRSTFLYLLVPTVFLANSTIYSLLRWLGFGWMLADEKKTQCISNCDYKATRQILWNFICSRNIYIVIVDKQTNGSAKLVYTMVCRTICWTNVFGHWPLVIRVHIHEKNSARDTHSAARIERKI